jgi:hypothetical protein
MTVEINALPVNAYKLTDSETKTYGGFQWELGTKRATCGSGELCGAGWLHYYQNPLLAVLLNPIHGDYRTPRLFEAHAGPVQKHDPGMKSGTTELTLLREIPLPAITTAQRVKFAQECAAFAKTAAAGRRMTHEAIVDALVKCAERAIA